MIKQYLREYVNYQQINWVSLLSIAQLIYNISIYTITRQTLFFTNYKYNTNLFLKLKKVTVLTEHAKIIVNKMHKLHRELQKNIKFLSHHLAFYYN